MHHGTRLAYSLGLDIQHICYSRTSRSESHDRRKGQEYREDEPEKSELLAQILDKYLLL